jgi:molecular chaperone DnaK (HSP70)
MKKNQIYENEKFTNDLFDHCFIPFETILDQAVIAISGINDFILVGETTQIPKIQSIIYNFSVNLDYYNLIQKIMFL